MDKVTICDHTFLEHTKSASIGGGNIGVGPTHFEWEYADAQTARFVTDGEIRYAKGRGQVALLLEPYKLHPNNYWRAWNRRDEFDAILMHSYHKFFDAIWYPYGGSWIAFEEWGMNTKSKDISIIISDKDTMPGHRLRNEIAKLVGDRVDVFHDFPDKYDALAPYFYSIVIESEKVPYYFTEKLIDCLCLGTVPIYWGDCGDYFDKDGIIQASTISDIEAAIDEILSGKRTLNTKAIEQNILKCRQFAVCEDWIYWHYPELFV